MSLDDAVRPEKEAGPDDLVKERELAAKLASGCPDAKMSVSNISRRRIWLVADPAGIRHVFGWAKEEWPDIHLSTISGLDDGDAMEVIYHFVLDQVLVNMKVRVDREHPEVHSISDMIPAADSYERELHDLLGVEFTGRTSTPRLVLPDEWEDGVYPLRKERKEDEKSV